MQNHPYRFWYLLKVKKSLKASIYFKLDNSVGINLISFNENLLRNIIYLILDVVKPLPKVDSIRPDFFTINLSIKNKLYKKTLGNIGLKKIQEVYTLKIIENIMKIGRYKLSNKINHFLLRKFLESLWIFVFSKRAYNCC